jgi:cytochrome b561
MSKHKGEITFAAICVAVVTGIYLGVYFLTGSYPDPSSIVGHVTGIIGTLLMLGAQVAYSLRKQTRDARWGPMVKWLQSHVIIGLVGPFMVLVHAAGKFNGVAGVSAGLTIVVIISGITGRYIYTSIPREIEGVDPVRLERAKKALATWRAIHIPITWALFTSAFVHAIAALYYATLLKY